MQDGGFELVEGVQEIAADGEQLQEDMQDTAQGIASPPRQVSDHSIVTDEGEEDVDTRCSICVWWGSSTVI